MSDRGNQYVLTIVDYATRYPEAISLAKIETEHVAEALLDVFCRVGFPKEVLITHRQLYTTPYNPKSNGLCERVNGVLKSMVKKMCQERPKD